MGCGICGWNGIGIIGGVYIGGIAVIGRGVGGRKTPVDAGVIMRGDG
jgi:hypothetical protein